MKAYILDSISVSAQHTFEANEEGWIPQEGAFLHAIDPNYRDYIPPTLIRRMSKVIKMSLACTHHVLNEEAKANLAAINVGTGLGCLRDSEKFLMQVCRDETGVMSPTSFIQSTHNTIAGQIALLGQYTCHNMTYSNVGHSFENAVEDSLMQLAEGNKYVLAGGADELTPFVESVNEALGCPADNRQIGEGAAYFLMGNTESEGAIELTGMLPFELSQTNILNELLDEFLSQHGVKFSDLDGIALGCTNAWQTEYDQVILNRLSENQTTLAFKTLSGEFHTASALGLDMAVQWMKSGHTHPQCILKSGDDKRPERVLVYNHYRGQNHAFYLLSK